jgi:hypothetical protein
MGLFHYETVKFGVAMVADKRRVYHFISKKYGLESVRERRIKISTFLGLNDPFELFAHDVSDKALRQLMHVQREYLDKQYGILCFSRSSRSPVQWAHYGDRNKGICLGFDIDASLLRDVQYRDMRINNFILPSNKDSSTAWLDNLLFTKYSHWSYEEEVRLFANLDTKVGGLYFKNFDDSFTLAEVQVGYHSDVTRSEISQALGHLESSVDVFKVRPAFQSFEMVRNKRDIAWK